MVDGTEFERWRREAGRTVDAARAQERDGFHNWACFQAEQAAHLAVKAFLHGVGEGPWGHDLVKLGERVAAVVGDDWTTGDAEAAGRLSRHYIPARYPDVHASGAASEHYGASDATPPIDDARAIIAAIDRLWGAVTAENDDG